MEFQITTDLSVFPQAIDFNFDALKGELDTKLGYYRSLVVTEDSIKAAKGDRAALNNLKKAIDNRRLEVKKQCLAPYESFERKCKELTGMIDKASDSIDVQVKSFEEAEKAEKRDLIEQSYHGQIGDLSGLLPFELFFDRKWLNKTPALPAVIEELSAMIESAKKDVSTLRDMHLSNEAAALSVYSKTRDIGAEISEKMRLKKLAVEAEKALREKETQEDLHQRQEAQLNHFTAPITETYFMQPEAPEVTEETKTIKVIFYDTTHDFRADMKALTEKHGIRYGGLK